MPHFVFALYQVGPESCCSVHWFRSPTIHFRVYAILFQVTTRRNLSSSLMQCSTACGAHCRPGCTSFSSSWYVNTTPMQNGNAWFERLHDIYTLVLVSNIYTYILNVLNVNKCTQRHIVAIACTRFLLTDYCVPLVTLKSERCLFSYCSPPLETDYMLYQMEYMWLL